MVAPGWAWSGVALSRGWNVTSWDGGGGGLVGRTTWSATGARHVRSDKAARPNLGSAQTRTAYRPGGNDVGSAMTCEKTPVLSADPVTASTGRAARESGSVMMTWRLVPGETGSDRETVTEVPGAALCGFTVACGSPAQALDVGRVHAAPTISAAKRPDAMTRQARRPALAARSRKMPATVSLAALLRRRVGPALLGDLVVRSGPNRAQIRRPRSAAGPPPGRGGCGGVFG